MENKAREKRILKAPFIFNPNVRTLHGLQTFPK